MKKSVVAMGEIDNRGTEPLSNFSTNVTFDSVLQAHQRQRRVLLKGGITAALTAFIGTGILTNNAAKAQSSGPRVGQQGTALPGFGAIPTSRADKLQLPEGYRAQDFVPWGTPIDGIAPAYKSDASNSGAEQELQVGSHHDGMHYFPINGRSDEGLLVLNHEFVDPTILHTHGPTLGETRPAAEVHKEMAAHGISVLHIRRDEAGNWSQVAGSRYNRRITAATPIELKGPVRGTAKLVTAYSPQGLRTRGTLNNCSHGVTPWNTYLAAEENWAGYFVNQDEEHPREQQRYGIARGHSRYGWEKADQQDDNFQRFDATPTGVEAHQDYRNEPNTFGWVTEIDPFDPEAIPVKRTGLGRFAHEGVVFAPVEEGQPIVCYSGDDARHEYIYKFVSQEAYHAATAGGHLLDKGSLYVARFDADGSGQWLLLDIQDAAFSERARAAGVSFTDQADVLVNARLAADIAGATKMDRPEWGVVDPNTHAVYFTLTNNIERTPDGVEPANPRANNETGHIIRWWEGSDGGFAAQTFNWEIFLLGGEEGTTTYGETSVILDETNQFASPDGLWFDPRGLLWVQTDMSGQQLIRGPFGNNQMLAVNPETLEIRRFLVGPVGCEVTGVVATPDLKTLFVNIQHPGEGSGPVDFSSHWPDGGKSRPRSCTIAISRKDGGLIGT